jgi:hypothetical protein
MLKNLQWKKLAVQYTVTEIQIIYKSISDAADATQLTKTTF